MIWTFKDVAHDGDYIIGIAATLWRTISHTLGCPSETV
jgi:hypothetical protein